MITYYLTRVYFNADADTTPAKQMWVKASNVSQIQKLFIKMYGNNFKKYEILSQIRKEPKQ